MRVGILFCSRDRPHIMHVTVPLLFESIRHCKADVTVLWLDGSDNAQALRYFRNYKAPVGKLVKVGGVKIGRCRCTRYGMEQLCKLGPFSLIGTIEMDVALEPCALQKTFDLYHRKWPPNMKPGLFSTYFIHDWVIEYHKDWLRLWAVGGSYCFFLPKVWKEICNEPLWIPISELRRLGMPVPPSLHTRIVAWDWCWSAWNWAKGYETIGTRFVHARNLGIPEGIWKMHPNGYVEKGDGKAYQGRGPVRRI